MAVKKTHVKSEKRQAREREQAALKEASRKRAKKSAGLGKKQKTVVQSGFRFKSQAERYKDISIDLKSLLEDAVERYGRYDVQDVANTLPDEQQEQQLDRDDEDGDEDDLMSTPLSTALAELALLNTSLPFLHLHRTLYRLTRSLPLIVHHRLKIAQTLIATLSNPNRIDLALSASHTIDVVPAFIQSLSPDPDFQLLDFDTILTPLIKSLVAIALDPPSAQNTTGGDRGNDPNAPTEISKRAFQVLAWLFREIGNDLVNRGDHAARHAIAWSWVREGLRGGKPEVTVPIIEMTNVDEADRDAVKQDFELDAEEEDRDAAENLDPVPDMQDGDPADLRVPEGAGAPLADNEVEEEVDPNEDPAEDAEGSSERLEATQKKSRRPMSATRPHMRRLLATCFAFLVRKAKSGSALESLTRTVLSELGDSQETSAGHLPQSTAWILLESVRSVANHIHSRGGAVYRAFLDETLRSENPVRAQVVEASLTALVHHARLEHFTPISSIVLQELRSTTEKAVPSFERELVYRLAGVLVGTRQGSRLSDQDRADVLALCEKSFAASADQPQGIVELSTMALLVASRLEDMLGPGRRLLDKIWRLPEQYAGLSSACIATLSAQRWPHFASFASPLVMSTSRSLQSPAHLSLLARLADDGNLTRGDALSSSLSATLVEKLKVWSQAWKNGKVTERQTRELLDCLSLTHTSDGTVDIAETLLSSIDLILAETQSAQAAKIDFAQSPTNASAVLAACLRTLSLGQDDAMPAETVIEIVQKFGWHRQVLTSLADLTRATDPSAPLADLAEPLEEAVLSEDSLLRSSAIRLLSSAAPDSEALQRCLEAEDVALTISNAREKTTALRRVGMALKPLTEKAPEFHIAIRFMVAMLKVNFKPLWTEAISSLSESVREHKTPVQEAVWTLVYDELRKAASLDAQLLAVAKPSWADDLHDDDTEEDKGTALERGEFRCTSHARIARTFASRRAIFEGRAISSGTSDPLAESQMSEDRLVIPSYEAQLLHLCAAIHTLVEKHSREFVTLFFTHFGDYTSNEEGDASAGRAGRTRLATWLEVFSKFKNPKALYQSSELYTYHLATLSHGDNALQRLALECILTWKSPNMVPHQLHLSNLLDESKFRDQLLDFSLAEDSDAILPSQRGEVVPITIRILYGVMSSRQGRAAAMHVQAGRKAAVLATLRTCSPTELDTLVDLMLAPFEDQRNSSAETFVFASAPPTASPSRQSGFLNLLADVLKHLSSKVYHRWDDLISVVLNLAHHSQPPKHDIDESNATISPKRRTRQLALRRLADFFTIDPTFRFTRYMQPLFASIVTPRLPTFPAENAQAPSALLELFVCWSADSSTAPYLMAFDAQLLPSIYDCLSVNNVKNSVVSRIILLLQRILAHAANEEIGAAIKEDIILPHITSLLTNMANLLSKKAATLNVRDELGMRQIGVLSELAAFIQDRDSASLFLPILLPLFRKPNAILPEKIKTDLLRVLAATIPLALSTEDARSEGSTGYDRAYETVSSLFATLRTRVGRSQLVQTFAQFLKLDPSLAPVSQLLDDLNAFSSRRLEEPDFDRRLPAFARLNETEYRTLSARHWIPVIHNMFYFIQDPEELSIRSNANLALRKYVEVAGPSLEADVRQVFTKVFLPGIKTGLRSKTEMVRVEIVSVMSAAVESSTGIAELEEMKCLLAGGDAEANFFNNIYHVQIHRRARAMRRLADECEAGHISSKTAADLFLPLLAHNLTTISENKHAELVNETVQCIGRIAHILQWSAYYRALQHYLRLAQDKGDGQKIFVRTSVALLRGFHFDLRETSEGQPSPLLATVINRVLPRLMQFLQTRDEAEAPMRIPMAEGIAVIVQALPEEEKAADVSSLITALAQILRSKAQDVRDLTRSTVINIAVALGTPYLATVVRELKSALARGPQLHILAFTLHSLLLKMTSLAGGVNVDACLDSAVPIVYDDIFGQPSKERDSQEFRAKTKIREVRSAKSLDSIEILSKTVSPEYINRLIGPLRDVIGNTESVKVMRDVDDVLRHIAIGLQINPSVDAGTLLGICHGLISQNTDFLKERKQKRGKGKQAAADYHVQMKRVKSDTVDHYAHNAHRFVSFGLDLLNGAFRKNKFDLQDRQIVARLDPLIALVGETLFAEEAHVLERAVRAVSSLIRCPLASIDASAPILVNQLISILEHTGGTSSELAQTAIRTLATIIRDRKGLVLKDEQLAYLIAIISPDMEETEQQPALFALLRAITSRTFVVPEIYDLMDRVAEILVTNQSAGTREICRSIYLQFLLDYPQGKKRLAASLEFLAKNLGGYVHESGRTSVLEFVNAILKKFTVELLDQHATLFFVSLTMDVANDQSPKCREMAAENLKVLTKRVSPAVRTEMTSMAFTWASAKGQKQLVRVSVQVLGIILEALDGKNEMEVLAKQILPVLTETVQDVAVEMEGDDEEDPDIAMLQEVEWQIPYQALQSLARLFRLSPSSLASASLALQQAVRSLLLFPHVWVRNASARLLGTLFAAGKSISADDLIEAASQSATQLRSKLLDDSLSLQVVKNLFTIGKHFAAMSDATKEHAETGNASISDEEADAEGDAEEEAEGAAEQGEPNGQAHRDPKSDPLHWLFVKLSHRARVAHQNRPSLYSAEAREYRWSLEPASILRWFGAMITEPSVAVSALEKQKLSILIPLVRITEDPNGAKDPQLDDLQVLAREVQELLSQKLGVTSVAETYSEIRRKMSMRREERKRASAMATVNDPELEGKRRAKRTETKAKARKRKNASFAETKMRYGAKSGKRARRE